MAISRPILCCSLFCLAAAGCSHHGDTIRQALTAYKPTGAQPAAARASAYAVACPDVLQLTVPGRSEWSGSHPVQADGCIELPRLGWLRVEGLTAQQIETRLNELANEESPVVAAGLCACCRVEIEQCCSRQVYVYGEVSGQQRAVPYQGPETVVQLLQRAGGITGDGATTEVQVVRNPLLAQEKPQVIRVDLEAILLRKDPRTDVTVQPYDQIYIPETKQSRLSRCFHPWFRRLGRLLKTGQWEPAQDTP